MRVRREVLAALTLAIAATGGPVWAQTEQPPLTVVSWGGAYTRAQMLTMIRPYREAAGEWVTVEEHRGGLDDIREQVSSLNVTWDVVDLELADVLRACEEGLLEPIDPAILAPAPNGEAATEDFYPKALQPCGIGQTVAATVVAYASQAFASTPTSIADFFDTSAFPGKRALRRTPRVNLEWALLADGVPRDQVYEVLDTEVGVRRAFNVLDRIAGNVIWWQRPDTPVELLENGAVTMGSAFNGRVERAVDAGTADLEILWDGNVWDGGFWGIVRGTERLDEALDFVRFTTETERLAEMPDYIPYGPLRRSAMALVDPEILPHLPTSYADETLEVDYVWWAENAERLETRFEAWLRAAGRPVYDFDADDRN